MTTFSTVAALTITTASIANGAGRVSTKVNNATNLYQRIHWYARFKTGTVPTAGALIEIYAYREDNHGTEYTSDGVTLTDAALSAPKPPNAHLIGTIVVTATSDVNVYGEGVWEDPGPGEWAMALWNATGATLSTTEADGFIHWVGEKA